MALRSRTFSGDPSFEACLLRDSAHITPGAQGDHVAKLQGVLMILDGALISDAELATRFYGPSTAAAVLAYKRKRRIIDSSYQTHADDIVGKLTIQALDDELQMRQQPTEPSAPRPCAIHVPPAHGSLRVASMIARLRPSKRA